MKLMSAVFARPERGAARAAEYFTPRLASADQQLQALAKRMGGAYQRGALDWATFAADLASGTTPDERGAGVWGRGSLVRKALHGLHVEVTPIVQPLSTSERGQAAWRWLVLAPRVTVTAGARASRLRFERFQASWFADDENATGADRLRPLRSATPSEAALEPMPPAVSSARDRLIEKVVQIGFGPEHAFAVGRPLPRAADDPREFGQASFEVPALLELIERARAFAHALATG